MSSELESEVCYRYRVRVALSGESYGGNRCEQDATETEWEWVQFR